MVREIFQYWESNINELPDTIVTNLDSWKRLPILNDNNVKYSVYNIESAKAFLRDNIGPVAVDVYDSFIDVLAASRSDVFRVAKLMVTGGVYWDVSHRLKPDTPGVSDDFICRELLFPEWELSVVTRRTGNRRTGFSDIRLSNSPLYSNLSGSRHFANIWDIIVDNVTNRRYPQCTWLATGPGVVHNYVARLAGIPEVVANGEPIRTSNGQIINTQELGKTKYINMLREQHNINIIPQHVFLQVCDVCRVNPSEQFLHWAKAQRHRGCIYK